MTQVSLQGLSPAGEEVAVAALEAVIARARGCALAGASGAGSWERQVRGAVGGLLRFVEENPEDARFFLFDALFAGERLRHVRRRAVAEAVAFVDRGREYAGDDLAPGPEVAWRVVEEVLESVCGAVRGGWAVPVSAFAQPLGSLLVLPYIAARASRGGSRAA